MGGGVAWAPEKVWTIWRKNAWPLPGIEPGFLRHPTRSQVTVLTELPRLLVKSTAGTTERHKKCVQKAKVIGRRAAEGPVTNVCVQQERSECS
jgi:hypothetical protein